MKILIGDSDPKTVEAVQTCCAKRWPYLETMHTGDPEELLRMVQFESPDLVVMDLDLPGISGICVCQEVRNFSEVPLIMIVPTGKLEEIVESLEAGADDCVSRPISRMELLARIIALFRRSQQLPMIGGSEPFISEDLYIDFDCSEVRKDGEEIKLTLTEFEILCCLARNCRRVISHARLACLSGGEDGEGARNSLKVHIQNLRHKLGESAREPRYIFNLRGAGYKFVAQEPVPSR